MTIITVIDHLDDSFTLLATMNPQSGKYCDYFDISSRVSSFLSYIVGGKAMKTISKYGLDMSYNEEDKEICFGLNSAASLGATGIFHHHHHHHHHHHQLFADG